MALTKKRCTCCKEQLLESFTFQVRDLKGGYREATLDGCRRCDLPHCVNCDKPIGEVHKPGLKFERCEHCGRRDPLVPDKVA